MHGDSRAPTISADSRYAAFASEADNLAYADSNDVSDVFVRDRTLGLTVRVSAGVGRRGQPGGGQADGPSGSPDISADGLTVAFVSAADNLVAGDTNGADDVFVNVRQGGFLGLVPGPTRRVSLTSTGGQPDGASSDPAISGDGRYVVFASQASNFITDRNAASDVFLVDLTSGEVDYPSLLGDGASFAPDISDDGRYVVFASDATDLVWADDNGTTDVFEWCRYGCGGARLSYDDGLAVGGNGPSVAPSISGDGAITAFASDDTANLSSRDVNTVTDIYYHRWNQTRTRCHVLLASVPDTPPVDE